MKKCRIDEDHSNGWQYLQTLRSAALFKATFGQPESAGITRHLLNALLRYRGKQRLRRVTVLNPGLSTDYLEEPGALVQLEAEDGLGQLSKIELHLQPEDPFIQHSLLQLSRLLMEDNPEPRVCLVLSDIVISPEHGLHSRFTINQPPDSGSSRELVDVHMVQLPLFGLSSTDQLYNPTDRWLYLLLHGHTYPDPEALPAELRDEPGVWGALTAWKKAQARPDVRFLVEAQDKVRWDRFLSQSKETSDAWESGFHQGRTTRRLWGGAEGNVIQFPWAHPN